MDDLVPPRTTLEVQVAQIVEELLGVSPIGVTQDLLAYGMDSVTVSRLALRIDVDGQPVRFYADLPTRDVVALEPGTLARVTIDPEHVRVFPADA